MDLIIPHLLRVLVTKDFLINSEELWNVIALLFADFVNGDKNVKTFLGEQLEQIQFL